MKVFPKIGYDGVIVVGQNDDVAILVVIDDDDSGLSHTSTLIMFCSRLKICI